MINRYEKYIEEHCKTCKNKKSDLCEIRRDIKDRLTCKYEKS